MKRSVIIAGLFLFGIVPPSQGQSSSCIGHQFDTAAMGVQTEDWKRYFPIQIGNSWTYSEYGIPNSLATFSIIDSIRIDGDLYFYWGGQKNTAQIIHSDSLGRIWQYIDNLKKLWFDFTLAEQDSYFYRIDDTFLNYVVKVSRNREMKTNLGVLDSCITFHFHVPGVWDVDKVYDFAPGIGLIQTLSGMGILHNIESAVINGKVITTIEPEKPKALFVSELCQNFPNPFNPQTTIRYELPGSGFVTTKVFDITSRLVKVLVSGWQTAGTQNTVWDGKDFGGNLVSAGIYFCRIEFADEGGKKLVQSKKMSLVK